MCKRSSISAVQSIACLLAAALAVLVLTGTAHTAQIFRVLDISERTFDNAPSIAVIFSHPLDPEKQYDQFIRISDDENFLKSAWILSEDNRTLYFPHIEAETTYSITVLEELESADGQKLDQRHHKALTTRKITPGVNFASNGMILTRDLAEGLPVATLNVNTVVLEFFRLNEEGVRNFIRWRHTNSRQDNYDISRAKENGEFVFSGRFSLDAPKNKRVVRHIPVKDIAELKKPGVYFTVMRQLGEYNYDYQATYFIVTDIGLHARIYKNQAAFFASSLKTGLPLKDVKITFFNKKIKQVREGKTDGAGRCDFDGSVRSQNIAFVKADWEDQVAFLPLEIPAVDLSEFDLGSRPQKMREIFVYSPRDLYRPGETVVLSAFLRDYDGRMTSTAPLQAEIFRPDGKKVRSFTWHAEKPEEFGPNYYETRIVLPGDAQTGRWRLELKDNPASRRPSMIYSFSVEDFMPERMKLELDSKQKVIAPDEDWVVDVDGTYLYGAPASGNELEAMISLRTRRNIIESLNEFQFGEIDDQSFSDYWEMDGLQLDDKGKTPLVVKNKWRDFKSPLAVRASISLFESGGRPVNRSIQRIVWPADKLVGIRPMFSGNSTDEGTSDFEVVSANPNGEMLAAKGLLVNLIKEDRDYYWEYSDDRGWEHKFTEKRYTYQADVMDLPAGEPGKYSAQLREGRYVLSIKNPETGFTSSVRFHVGYWWYGDDRLSSRPDKVQLKLDKPSYRPGDMIKLTVTPPHSGDALILIEGDRPLWFKRLHVSATGTEVEIPVSAAWDSHDIYISAVVFRPGDAVEKITPNRAIGLIHLPLDRSDRTLSLSIEAPDRIRPQGPTPMTAKIKLNNKKDGRYFVTMAAVDVGILSITDFKTPDPAKWFFEQRRYAVDGYDLYGKVVEIMDGEMAKLKCGGDADMSAGGKRPETQVKLVSLFQGPVVFNEQGEADIAMTLPGDFNGRLRLMAVAFSHDSYGSAETEVTVAAPVVAQLSTPRFLSPGDEAVFTLDVHNLSDQDQQLKINMSASYPVVLDNGEKTLNLKDQEKTTLRFPVTVKPDFMASEIRMHLEGEGVLLDNKWVLGVRPGYPGVARKQRVILKPGETFELDRYIAADLMPGSIEADFKVSPVIPINMKDAMRYLIDYPYGCLEQTTSRAYPLIYATPVNIQKFGLINITHEDRIRRVNKAIESISLMQRKKGGFSLWNESGPEHPWLTAYAADLLLQARDQGFDVPAAMLDNALKRLEFYVTQKWKSKSEGIYNLKLDFAVRSYSAFVLARVGRAPLGTLRTIYDNHKSMAVSELSLTHLGLALKLMGDKSRSDEALKSASEIQRDKEIYYGDYGSEIRDLALTTALFVEYQVEYGLEDMMMKLNDELRERRWFSTQESFAVFKLGLALDAVADKPWSGLLTVNKEQRRLDKKGPLFLSPSPEEIHNGVAFKSTHDKLMYVSAVVSGYTKTAPEKDEARIILTRDFFDTKGEKIEGGEFNVGDLVLVHLTATAKEYIPDALVVDLLPAGFEIENPNFKYSVKISDSELEEVKINEQTLWRLSSGNRIEHQEYKDDRYVSVMHLEKKETHNLFYLMRAVSPGKFTVPPPYAESMYRPEIRGVGETPTPVTIINKRQ